MLTLAQATATPAPAAAPGSVDNLFHAITSVFSRADALAHPGAIVDALRPLSVVWAVVFLVVGLMCLFNGYKFHKAATVGLAALIGLFAGYTMGERLQIDTPYIIAGCLAVLLAVVAMPLMKYAVAGLGGLAGAFIGGNTWSSVAMASGHPDAVQHHWIGALMGLIILGMLAFVVFKLSVVLYTSVSGSTLAVMGAIALLLNLPDTTQASIARGLTSHAIIIPMLVLVPAVIGLILQQNAPAPAGSGGGGGGGGKK